MCKQFVAVSDLGSGSASTTEYLTASTAEYLTASQTSLLLPELAPSSSLDGHSLLETTHSPDLTSYLRVLHTLPTPTGSLTQSSSTLTTPTTVPRPSVMVEVPPDGTLSLPRVIYIAIPVGLGFVLVSMVLVLCGSFVCFKRRSKYATETPTG